MADRSYQDGTRVRRADESPAGTPRWVKAFGIISVVVVLLFIILMLTRGPGGHTPLRHFGSQASLEGRPQ